MVFPSQLFKLCMRDYTDHNNFNKLDMFRLSGELFLKQWHLSSRLSNHKHTLYPILTLKKTFQHLHCSSYLRSPDTNHSMPIYIIHATVLLPVPLTYSSIFPLKLIIPSSALSSMSFQAGFPPHHCLI